MVAIFKKNRAKNDRELWALSLSAPLFQINGFQHEFLYGHKRKSKMIPLCEFIERDWNIHNHDELISTLKWLETAGHQDEFMGVLSVLTSLSEKGCDRFIASCKGEGEKYEKWKIVNYYKLPLKRVGIAAWDINRYVFLCRTATVMGLMDEKQAWDLIFKMAPNAQKIFTSWREYALSYFAGRQYWLGNSAVDFANEMREIIKQLLVWQDGIWHDLNWDTRLER
jgi:hypothetical protein